MSSYTPTSAPDQAKEVPSTLRPKGVLSQLKPVAWRSTALYVWVKIIAAFLGWYTEFGQIEASLADRLVHFLSSFGFAPVNPTNLLATVKVGWILVIAGFRVGGLFWLGIYVLSFPIWCPLALLFGRFIRTLMASEPPTVAGEVTKRRERPRLLFTCALFLVAWLLLYGGAGTQRQTIPGVVLSFAILMILCFRLFLRAKPSSETEARLGPFGWLIRIADTARSLESGRRAKEYKKKSDLQIDLKVARFTRKLIVRLARLLHGPRARERVSVLVLAGFVASLIAVAAAAILFWALSIKAAPAAQLPFLVCLQFSVSHFLPGIDPPHPDISLPLWASIGPAATAWILFVLYIGPASSLLPDRQKATLNGLSRTYDLYRKAVRVLGLENRKLKRIEKNMRQ